LIETRGIVVSNKPVARAIYQIEIETEQFEPRKPGQFAMIGTSDEDFHLNRPFSIYRQVENRLTFLIQKRGKISKRLIKKRAGDRLRIIGPLGNWFSETQAVVVAAGSSIAVFGDFIDNGSTIFYAASTKEDLIDIDASFVSTMDGSFGFRGNLVELFKAKFEKSDKRSIYLAGPSGFIKAFRDSVDKEIIARCYVSLESYMGCGFGVCQGCVINAKNGYKRVCKDGTIFRLNEIIL